MENLPADEVQGWLEYFRRYPPGWRDDSRFALLIQYIASIVGGKVKPEELFDSIKRMKAEERRRLVENARKNKPDFKEFLESIMPRTTR